MNIYNYNSETKEFISQNSADSDPLNKGEFLIPANATIIKPGIKPGENQAIVFDEENKVWKTVHDFRGSEYWTDDGEHHVIPALNETVPDEALFTKPDLRTLNEIVTESLGIIKDRHAKVLDELSGSATTQERDTWPLQKEWAIDFISSPNDHHEVLLKGLLTVGENAALGENAAKFMADKIIAKSHAMDLLTSKAGGLKREAEQALNSANTKEEVQLIMGQLNEKMQTTIQEFLQAVNNG